MISEATIATKTKQRKIENNKGHFFCNLTKLAYQKWYTPRQLRYKSTLMTDKCSGANYSTI
jgi:hypothetical protein